MNVKDIIPDDLVDVRAFLMNRHDSEGIINIRDRRTPDHEGSGQMSTELVGAGWSIEFDGSRPDGATRKPVDVSGLKPFWCRARIGIRETIEQTGNG